MPLNPNAIECGAAATGVNSRSPQLIVHQAALALRQLLDEGASHEDPRCRALLQLVNAARLVLLPNSNNAAKLAVDLTSKAVHIDVSTATVAAIMGLKNAGDLTGAALAQVNSRPAKPSSTPPSSERLSLQLLPRPAQKAVDALIELVKSDIDLGTRARNEALYRSSTMANKLHKLRAGQRHATVRKQRLADQALENAAGSGDILPPQPPPIPQLPPPPQLPPAPQFPSTVPLPGGNASPGSNAFARFILPRRRNLVYSSPVPLPMEQIPPPQPSSLQRSENRTESVSEQQTARISGDGGQSSSGFSRFRAKQTLQSQEVTVPPPVTSPSDKGVMNDTIGTPNDVMEAFMHPLNKSYELPQENLDNPTKIRSVLAERERILYRLQRKRQGELAAMPLGMTEQTRRKAIIEAKQLSLIDLQRVTRYRVCAEMKKMYSLAVQEGGSVPTDHLSRLFRRRDPPIYSYTDGYPRITPFDGIPEMAPRPSVVVAQDSIRMAQFDMSRMNAQKVQRKKEFGAKLLAHYEHFQNAMAHARNCRGRIWKGFERYFLEKKRIEEKKRKMERIERLRLLRSNDEQAYLNLLKDTKNERLLQLVRQTDSYLMRIGAQVEKAREQADPSGGGHNAFAEELVDRDVVPIEAMRRRRDLYYTVTHAVQEEVRQPSIMVHGTLKPYQIEGLKWMVSLYNNNLNGILADEMGLGKTIQTISLITYLVETKKNPGPFLVIVPLSTMGNWIRELDLWAPSLVKVAYRGDRNTRRAIQQKQMLRSDYNVLLTTYEFTVKDQSVLSRVNWQYIIIDEGHRMKNANCKLAMTLGVKYKSRNRLLLTGTPLQNNLTELWALLNFLLPTIFSSADTFETWFKQPFESTTLGDSAELEEEETLLVINRLHQVLRPFLLRRLKTDVESQLPQKVEHVIRCDMSAWQRVLYRQVQSRVGLATGSHNGTVKAYNNLLMQCKKICNHPYLFYGAEAILDLPPEHFIRASGKFCLLQHMLPKLRLHGHRTLIFSQMTAALDYLEDFLNVIGIQYMRLDGNTKADDRQALLNRFNAKDSPYFCFLLSTRAGGLGLNLQTADTVIIFDSDWNPMMDLQAQDRAHRIGQTKVVRVYRLICSGTVEVKILEQANRKLQVDAQVIQAGQFNNKSTELDRHQMLKNLLRQKNDGDELGVVPDMEELNRLFARNDEEFEAYCKFDEESIENGTYKQIFDSEAELPDWVLQPDVEHKTEEEKDKELMLSHGRGRRQRKATLDLTLLTDAEWLKVMEGEITAEEAFERRKRRQSSNGTSREGSSAGAKDDSASSPPGDASEKESHVDGIQVATNSSKQESLDKESSPDTAPEAKQEPEKNSEPASGAPGLGTAVPSRKISRPRKPSSKQRALEEEKEAAGKNSNGAPTSKHESADENIFTANGTGHVTGRSSKKDIKDAAKSVSLKLRIRPSDAPQQRKRGRDSKRKSRDGGDEVAVPGSPRKRQRMAYQSPSDKIVLPEEDAHAAPANGGGDHTKTPKSATERSFERKRKRKVRRAGNDIPLVNGSIRKRPRTDDQEHASIPNGITGRAELSGRDGSVSPISSGEVSDDEQSVSLNGSDSQQNITLKLRVRRDGSRRNTSRF